MEGLILAAIIITLVAGLCYFLLMRFPLDIGEIRTWGLYAIVAIYVVAMLIKVVIPLLHALFAAV